MEAVVIPLKFTQAFASPAVTAGAELVIVTPPVELETEIPVPAETEVTPELVTVTAPVVELTEIPDPAETEFTLALVLTGAVVCVVESLKVRFVPEVVIAIYCSYYGVVPAVALAAKDKVPLVSPGIVN